MFLSALAAALAVAAPAAPRPVAAEPWGRADLPICNGDFTPDGRMVLSTHPLFQSPIKAIVLTPPAAVRPFPDAGRQSPRPGAPYLDSVQGVRTDSHGVTWLLDMGEHGHITPKLVGWDTRTNRLLRVIPIPPPASIPESELQDFVFDARRGLVFMADEAAGNGGDGSKGALVVLDLKSGRARRLLQGAPSTRAEPIDVVVDGQRMVKTDSKTGKQSPMRSAADGIALDAQGRWLYWGALNGHTVWRARVDDLLDARLSPADLESRVERYADKPNAGGMWMDARGNLYMTEVEHHAVGVVPAQGRRYRRVMQDRRIEWPDGVGPGPGGYIYVTDSQLPLAAPLNGGRLRAHPPFRIWRFRPPADLGPVSAAESSR